MPKLLLCVLFGAAALAWAPARAAEVEIIEPWVRATVAGQSVTAAYLSIRSAVEGALVAIVSPVADKAEIHRTEVVDGAAQMRRVNELKFPKGGSVALSVGGDHVMLFGLKKALVVGETVPLKLIFKLQHGMRKSFEVKATVRALDTR